ncbi:MAG: hypothetical protein H6959_00105 [Chromatiaceae bacterium]|nr:hypothetical protein [Chromatiaceae bacterium]MCP5421295.1 hypothetical protein [Chromatiaceae bacterium]
MQQSARDHRAARCRVPQRDALAGLTPVVADWLGKRWVMRLRDEADRVTRYVGVLDAAREHAAVAQQELTRHLPDRMNRRVYVLSVVAAIFLPLRWLTGLLGINVGGIPLTDNLLGFGTIVALRVALTPAQVIVFRWRKWFEAGQCATRGPRGRQKARRPLQQIDDKTSGACGVDQG